MELKLIRFACKPKYTVGKLYVDGKFFCNTLEDTDRGLDESMSEKEILDIKKPNETAIPTGQYQITLSVQSPKYKTRVKYAFCNGFLPRLIGVKGYSGILIHIGNTHEDSSGCILVGDNKVVGQVVNSTNTFKNLYSILKAADGRGEQIYITIEKS